MTSLSAATLREEQKGADAKMVKGGKTPVEVADFNPSSGLQARPFIRPLLFRYEHGTHKTVKARFWPWLPG